MKITQINVYQVDLPLHEGSYKWSGGKSVTTFDSTVVEIKTDAGITGLGEVCPLGPVYLPSYASGARTGIAELAPNLINQNPLELQKINRHMDHCLKGHPYAKSALDMAFWDILGQASNQPLVTLFGGRYGEDHILYRAISQLPPDQMVKNVQYYRDQGYKRFQLKVGGDPDTDIQRIHLIADQLQPGEKLIADANTGWTLHEAIRVANAVKDRDVYIEQPCLTYNECRTVREKTNLPFVLDENIDSIHMLAQVVQDRSADVVNLKISKFGGLTKTLQAREFCIAHGIAMTIEDTWGGDIITSAISHLAHSTPPELLFTSTDFNSYVTKPLATNAPQRQNGRLTAPNHPGLGITLLPEIASLPKTEYKA